MGCKRLHHLPAAAVAMAEWTGRVTTKQLERSRIDAAGSVGGTEMIPLRRWDFDLACTDGGVFPVRWTASSTD